MVVKGFWERIEKLALFLWLLLIPTQLGKHFWPEWSHVLGLRSDYLVPILYFTDLIWAIWMGTKLINNYKLLINNWKKELSFENLLLGIFVFLNIMVAGNRWVAAYKWLRIIQWIIIYKVIKVESYQVKKYLKLIIPYWLVSEVFLGVAQIVKGGSLQGWWYWLGERRFALSTIGVAQISVLGEGMVRAYGTFSHPNSMAGFLLVSVIMWSRLGKKRNIFFWVVTWLGVIGTIITGSRIVWALLVVVVLSGFGFKSIKKFGGMAMVLTGLFLVVVAIVGMNYRTNDFIGGWDQESLSKRIGLNMVALKMWKENYMMGVGAGNFVSKLPEFQTANRFYWLQPVHNIFLLAGVEMGMLGIMLIIKFIISNLELRTIRKNYLILGVIVVTGLFDHYWVTLPQNYNLLVVILAVI